MRGARGGEGACAQGGEGGGAARACRRAWAGVRWGGVGWVCNTHRATRHTGLHALLPPPPPPPLAHHLAHPPAPPAPPPLQLRLAVSGSAACPLPIMQRWEALAGTRQLERYGMTETGMILGNPLR